MGGMLSGAEATRAWLTSQNNGPITPSRTTNITMLRPVSNLGLSQGESQRLRRKRATFSGNRSGITAGWTGIVVIVYLLPLIGDARINKRIKQVNDENAECYTDNQKIDQTLDQGVIGVDD